jgi:hypothetical protein
VRGRIPCDEAKLVPVRTENLSRTPVVVAADGLIARKGKWNRILDESGTLNVFYRVGWQFTVWWEVRLRSY